MSPETSSADALGPYRLLRPLGKGGMGAVYLAQDRQLNRNVAIKQLLVDEHEPGYATLKKRFLREAQSAANLNHPNIVTIYHIGEEAGQPFIVMEFVEGGSWADYLRRHGGVEWTVALAAIRDAAAGLVAAHGAGIIHRDIKPANLMRRPSAADGAECLTKIVDFGLARAALGDADLTHPGAFIGSPSYVSPEQAACQRVDPRSDVYSLGCTLFALLTGRAPFVDDDPAEILQQHRNAPLPAVGEFSREFVPQSVVALLEGMTAKRPEDRLGSAQAVIAAIDRLPLEAFSEIAKRKVATPKAGGPVEVAEPRWKEPESARAAVPPEVESSIAELQRRLEDSKASGNLHAERDTHLALFHLHSRLNNLPEATRAARHALALHIKLAQPGRN